MELRREENKLRRRELIKSGLISLASASTISASAFNLGQARGTYVEGERIMLRSLMQATREQGSGSNLL